MGKASAKRKLAVAAVSMVSCIISAILVTLFFHTERQRNIEHGRFIVGSQTNKIQYSIDTRLLNLEILEMLIVDNGGMIDDFDNIAALLFAQDPSMRSIQLAPNGVITNIYPLKGNEKGFTDLFANPERRDEAAYARDTGNMTLAGPYELYQGGMGVVARRPIYLEDEDGKKTFWGFSIEVMDIPEIFDVAQLENLLKDGYAFQIWRYPPDSKEKQIIAGVDKLPADAVSAEILRL